MSVIALALACWLLLFILALAMLRVAGRAERSDHRRVRASEPAPDRAAAPRRKRPAPMIAAMAALVAGGLGATASDARATGACARPGPAARTICLINAERTKRGLAALRVNTKLIRAAHRHSLDMVARRYFAHQSLSGRTLIDRLRIVGYLGGGCAWSAGETIAWGSGGTASPASRVRSWMRSARHKPILLGAAFREVGIGIAHGTPAGVGGATYTADFGRRHC